jgi:predicted enzyme related to lactoylglutathione lyase
VPSDQGDDDVIGIGEFALLTGLSVPRLRRYHDLDLLVPARVDSQSGYRSYAPEQVAIGRRVNQLRQVDLPLEEVGRVLAGPGAAVDALRQHRERLIQRVAETTRMVELVDGLIREERRMSNTSVQLMEVILRVEDVDRTVDFYRQVFGMEFQADDHNGALPTHYDACGGAWDPEGFFMLTIYPADGRPTKASVGFGVPDLDATWNRAVEGGATELTPPTDSGYMPRHATFEDTAGNRVNLYQRTGDW